MGTPDEVYDQPAPPFVLEFLGQVNRLPGLIDASGTPAYARPHEIAVSLQPVPGAWPARLTHSATVGPVTRLEFAVEGRNAPVNVELPRAEFRALSLAAGTIAYLRATNIRHFARSPG